jgi:PPIC-type PPIASE domain
MRRPLFVILFWVGGFSPAGRADVLLKGIAVNGGEPMFALVSTDDHTSKWILLGQSFAGARAVSFNAPKGALTVEVGGARKDIYLQQPEIGKGEAQSAQPLLKAEIRLKLIQLKRREAETDQQLLDRAKNTVIAKLSAGIQFADVAKEYSDDARKSKGGDWGWVKPEDFRPEFRDIAFALKNGELSRPFLRPEGWFLLLAEDSR